MENRKDNLIVTKGKKIYEIIQSKVHPSVWHIAEFDLRCDEPMPSENELISRSNEIVEEKKMSEEETNKDE